jgi:hypothetical protein
MFRISTAHEGVTAVGCLLLFSAIAIRIRGLKVERLEHCQKAELPEVHALNPATLELFELYM